MEDKLPALGDPLAATAADDAALSSGGGKHGRRSGADRTVLAGGRDLQPAVAAQARPEEPYGRPPAPRSGALGTSLPAPGGESWLCLAARGVRRAVRTEPGSRCPRQQVRPGS